MTIWTPEETAIVKKFYRLRPASEIGEMLGKTRYAVIGRANRLGLCLPVKTKMLPIKKERCATYTAKKIAVNKKPLTRKQAALKAFGKPKKLEDLKRNECHWPLGSGKDMMFCGCQVKEGNRANGEGHVYCTNHYKVSVSPNQKRKTKKSNFVKWRL